MDLTRRGYAVRHLLLLALALGVGGVHPSAQDLRLPLSEAQAHEASTLIARMQADPRGPYQRIRWHCADGSVHPPTGTPCRERGGGVQYAELNDAATQLAAIGVYTGTVLQSLGWERFWEAQSGHHRLKSYILEQYLAEIDDGWVLRRARYYRGARQIEDEEQQGQAFLEQLLSDPNWTRRHFLLASEAVAVVPHLTSTRRPSTPSVRNLATQLAGLDDRFQPLRVKIHSFPSHADLGTVETALRGQHEPAVREVLERLRQELRMLYDAGGASLAFDRFRQALGPPLAVSIARAQDATDLRPLVDLSSALHAEITRSTDGKRNLMLMDLNHLVQQQAFLFAQSLPDAATSHLQRLTAVDQLLSLAATAGYLSAREREAVAREIESLHRTPQLPARDYKARLDRLSASVDWSVATVNQLFGPTVGRYAQVERKAAGFVDALVRSSVVLPLAARLDDLRVDVHRRLGQTHLVFGHRVAQGVVGMNPGVALRRLEIWQPGEGPPRFDPTAIYVLPELPSEMSPVAGILTLDQGNLLSHVQLLARNLGIPNASIPGSLLSRLRQHEGQQVFLAVSPGGQVVLNSPTELTLVDRGLLEESRAVRAERIELSTARLRLDATQPIPLEDLGAEDAGVVVGPKAANLGELARRFPDSVAPGLALPFGMYRRHVDRSFGSDRTLHEEIQLTLRRAEAMRARGLPEEEIDRVTLERLAELRQAIVDLEWIPDMRRAILDAARETFGDDFTGGVFIRSDTNVEDLPQFTGAGLNLTVPHQTTDAAVLAAIKAVWASPFRERPYQWRKQILSNQEHIYPSVLLLRSVPSDKSGVLITSGLQFGAADDVTIVTAEGVGGGVDGESAETLVVDGRGSIRLLSQAKAPFHRVLNDEGGVRWVPSSRPDALLSPGEVQQLMRTIARWRQTSPAAQRSVVWDMEFGFAAGSLWLFQIRPFVPYRSFELHQRLQALDGERSSLADQMIDLSEGYAIQ